MSNDFTITRVIDGKEITITLTEGEMLAAYSAVEHENDREVVTQYAIEDGIILTDEQIDWVAERSRSNQAGSFFLEDCIMDCVKLAVEELLTGKAKV